MPNWVYNSLTIEGNPDSVNKLKEQVGKSFTLAQENQDMGDISSNGFPTKIVQVNYANPIFAFHNIYSYKDAGITDEEYDLHNERNTMPNYKVITNITLEVFAENVEEAVAIAESHSFDEWEVLDNEVTEITN
jgi:hypothetical protein